MADEEVRTRRQTRDQQRRADHDEQFSGPLVAEIGQQFPGGCPAGLAETIARHPTTRQSGRVGRSALGRALDPEAVTLAVVASVRHVETPMTGC